MSFALSVNDYGFELLSHQSPPLDKAIRSGLFSTDNLAEDIETAINQTELARRQFRGIARISGLVFAGFPGHSKSLSQIQATSSLIFDVFARHDPNNPLVTQRLQVGVPSQPVESFDQSRYIFRLTDAQPTHEPETLDEVKDAVTRDAKKKAAYDLLLAEKDKWVGRARKEKFADLAKELKVSVINACARSSSPNAWPMALTSAGTRRYIRGSRQPSRWAWRIARRMMRRST